MPEDEFQLAPKRKPIWDEIDLSEKDPDAQMTFEELAALFGVGVGTVKGWGNEGERATQEAKGNENIFPDTQPGGKGSRYVPPTYGDVWEWLQTEMIEPDAAAELEPDVITLGTTEAADRINEIAGTDYDGSDIRRMIEDGTLKGEKEGSRWQVDINYIDHFAYDSHGIEPPPSVLGTGQTAAMINEALGTSLTSSDIWDLREEGVLVGELDGKFLKVDRSDIQDLLDSGWEPPPKPIGTGDAANRLQAAGYDVDTGDIREWIDEGFLDGNNDSGRWVLDPVQFDAFAYDLEMGGGVIQGEGIKSIQQTPETREFMTTEEVMDYLGATTATFQKWLAEGKLWGEDLNTQLFWREDIHGLKYSATEVGKGVDWKWVSAPGYEIDVSSVRSLIRETTYLQTRIISPQTGRAKKLPKGVVVPPEPAATTWAGVKTGAEPEADPAWKAIIEGEGGEWWQAPTRDIYAEAMEREAAKEKAKTEKKKVADLAREWGLTSAAVTKIMKTLPQEHWSQPGGKRKPYYANPQALHAALLDQGVLKEGEGGEVEPVQFLSSGDIANMFGWFTAKGKPDLQKVYKFLDAYPEVDPNSEERAEREARKIDPDDLGGVLQGIIDVEGNMDRFEMAEFLVPTFDSEKWQTVDRYSSDIGFPESALDKNIREGNVVNVEEIGNNVEILTFDTGLVVRVQYSVQGVGKNRKWVARKWIDSKSQTLYDPFTGEMYNPSPATPSPGTPASMAGQGEEESEIEKWWKEKSNVPMPEEFKTSYVREFLEDVYGWDEPQINSFMSKQDDAKVDPYKSNENLYDLDMVVDTIPEYLGSLEKLSSTDVAQMLGYKTPSGKWDTARVGREANDPDSLLYLEGHELGQPYLWDKEQVHHFVDKDFTDSLEPPGDEKLGKSEFRDWLKANYAETFENEGIDTSGTVRNPDAYWDKLVDKYKDYSDPEKIGGTYQYDTGVQIIAFINDAIEQIYMVSKSDAIDELRPYYPTKAEAEKAVDDLGKDTDIFGKEYINRDSLDAAVGKFGIDAGVDPYLNMIDPDTGEVVQKGTEWSSSKAAAFLGLDSTSQLTKYITVGYLDEYGNRVRVKARRENPTVENSPWVVDTTSIFELNDYLEPRREWVTSSDFSQHLQVTKGWSEEVALKYMSEQSALFTEGDESTARMDRNAWLPSMFDEDVRYDSYTNKFYKGNETISSPWDDPGKWAWGEAELFNNLVNSGATREDARTFVNKLDGWAKKGLVHREKDSSGHWKYIFDDRSDMEMLKDEATGLPWIREETKWAPDPQGAGGTDIPPGMFQEDDGTSASASEIALELLGRVLGVPSPASPSPATPAVVEDASKLAPRGPWSDVGTAEESERRWYSESEIIEFLMKEGTVDEDGIHHKLRRSTAEDIVANWKQGGALVAEGNEGELGYFLKEDAKQYDMVHKWYLEEIPNAGVVQQNITVEAVLDGDTVRLSNGESVRILGMNTPEFGQPGWEAGTEALEAYIDLYGNEAVALQLEWTGMDEGHVNPNIKWTPRILGDLVAPLPDGGQIRYTDFARQYLADNPGRSAAEPENYTATTYLNRFRTAAYNGNIISAEEAMEDVRALNLSDEDWHDRGFAAPGEETDDYVSMEEFLDTSKTRSQVERYEELYYEKTPDAVKEKAEITSDLAAKGFNIEDAITGPGVPMDVFPYSQFDVGQFDTPGFDYYAANNVDPSDKIQYPDRLAGTGEGIGSEFGQWLRLIQSDKDYDQKRAKEIQRDWREAGIQDIYQRATPFQLQQITETGTKQGNWAGKVGIQAGYWYDPMPEDAGIWPAKWASAETRDEWGEAFEWFTTEYKYGIDPITGEETKELEGLGIGGEAWDMISDAKKFLISIFFYSGAREKFKQVTGKAYRVFPLSFRSLVAKAGVKESDTAKRILSKVSNLFREDPDSLNNVVRFIDDITNTIENGGLVDQSVMATLAMSSDPGHMELAREAGLNMQRLVDAGMDVNKVGADVNSINKIGERFANAEGMLGNYIEMYPDGEVPMELRNRFLQAEIDAKAVGFTDEGLDVFRANFKPPSDWSLGVTVPKSTGELSPHTIAALQNILDNPVQETRPLGAIYSYLSNNSVPIYGANDLDPAIDGKLLQFSDGMTVKVSDLSQAQLRWVTENIDPTSTASFDIATGDIIHIDDISAGNMVDEIATGDLIGDIATGDIVTGIGDMTGPKNPFSPGSKAAVGWELRLGAENQTLAYATTRTIDDIFAKAEDLLGDGTGFAAMDDQLSNMVAWKQANPDGGFTDWARVGGRPGGEYTPQFQSVLRARDAAEKSLVTGDQPLRAGMEAQADYYQNMGWLQEGTGGLAVDESAGVIEAKIMRWADDEQALANIEEGWRGDLTSVEIDDAISGLRNEADSLAGKAMSETSTGFPLHSGMASLNAEDMARNLRETADMLEAGYMPTDGQMEMLRAYGKTDLIDTIEAARPNLKVGSIDDAMAELAQQAATLADPTVAGVVDEAAAVSDDIVNLADYTSPGAKRAIAEAYQANPGISSADELIAAAGKGKPGLIDEITGIFSKLKNWDEIADYAKFVGKGLLTVAILTPDVTDLVTDPAFAHYEQMTEFEQAQRYSALADYNIAPEGYVLIDLDEGTDVAAISALADSIGVSIEMMFDPDFLSDPNRKLAIPEGWATRNQVRDYLADTQIYYEDKDFLANLRGDIIEYTEAFPELNEDARAILLDWETGIPAGGERPVGMGYEGQTDKTFGRPGLIDLPPISPDIPTPTPTEGEPFVFDFGDGEVFEFPSAEVPTLTPGVPATPSPGTPSRTSFADVSPGTIPGGISPPPSGLPSPEIDFDEAVGVTRDAYGGLALDAEKWRRWDGTDRGLGKVSVGGEWYEVRPDAQLDMQDAEWRYANEDAIGVYRREVGIFQPEDGMEDAIDAVSKHFMRMISPGSPSPAATAATPEAQLAPGVPEETVGGLLEDVIILGKAGIDIPSGTAQDTVHQWAQAVKLDREVPAEQKAGHSMPDYDPSQLSQIGRGTEAALLEHFGLPLPEDVEQDADYEYGKRNAIDTLKVFDNVSDAVVYLSEGLTMYNTVDWEKGYIQGITMFTNIPVAQFDTQKALESLNVTPENASKLELRGTLAGFLEQGLFGQGNRELVQGQKEYWYDTLSPDYEGGDTNVGSDLGVDPEGAAIGTWGGIRGEEPELAPAAPGVSPASPSPGGYEPSSPEDIAFADMLNQGMTTKEAQAAMREQAAKTGPRAIDKEELRPIAESERAVLAEGFMLAPKYQEHWGNLEDAFEGRDEDEELTWEELSDVVGVGKSTMQGWWRDSEDLENPDFPITQPGGKGSPYTLPTVGDVIAWGKGRAGLEPEPGVDTGQGPGIWPESPDPNAPQAVERTAMESVPEGWLTLEQVARDTGLPEDVIKGWPTHGMPAADVGAIDPRYAVYVKRKVYFDPEGVNFYIEAINRAGGSRGIRPGIEPYQEDFNSSLLSQVINDELGTDYSSSKMTSLIKEAAENDPDNYYLDSSGRWRATQAGADEIIAGLQITEGVDVSQARKPIDRPAEKVAGLSDIISEARDIEPTKTEKVDYFTTTSLSEIMETTSGSISAAITRGELEAKKVNGQWQIDPDSANAYKLKNDIVESGAILAPRFGVGIGDVDFFTSAELSESLGEAGLDISSSKITSAIKSGELKATQYRGKWQIDVESANKFMLKKEIEKSGAITAPRATDYPELTEQERADIAATIKPAEGGVIGWIPSKDAGETLGISSSAAINLAKSGRVEGTQVGGQWFIKAEGLEDLGLTLELERQGLVKKDYEWKGYYTEAEAAEVIGVRKDDVFTMMWTPSTGFNIGEGDYVPSIDKLGQDEEGNWKLSIESVNALIPEERDTWLIQDIIKIARDIELITPQTEVDKEFYTSTEAGARLGKSKKSVEEMLFNKELEGVIVRGNWQVNPDSVTAMLGGVRDTTLIQDIIGIVAGAEPITPEQPTWINYADSAKELDISTKQLSDLLADKVIQGEKVGGTWQVDAKSIDEYKFKEGLAAKGFGQRETEDWRTWDDAKIQGARSVVSEIQNMGTNLYGDVDIASLKFKYSLVSQLGNDVPDEALTETQRGAKAAIEAALSFTEDLGFEGATGGIPASVLQTYSDDFNVSMEESFGSERLDRPSILDIIGVARDIKPVPAQEMKDFLTTKELKLVLKEDYGFSDVDMAKLSTSYLKNAGVNDWRGDTRPSGATYEWSMDSINKAFGLSTVEGEGRIPSVRPRVTQPTFEEKPVEEWFQGTTPDFVSSPATPSRLPGTIDTSARDQWFTDYINRSIEIGVPLITATKEAMFSMQRGDYTLPFVGSEPPTVGAEMPMRDLAPTYNPPTQREQVAPVQPAPVQPASWLDQFIGKPGVKTPTWETGLEQDLDEDEEKRKQTGLPNLF